MFDMSLCVLKPLAFAHSLYTYEVYAEYSGLMGHNRGLILFYFASQCIGKYIKDCY